jgi:Rieske Fe-S protein
VCAYARAGAAIVGLYMGKSIARTIVDYKSMARDQLALACVEIDVTKIPEGQSQTFEWRGKPVFVRHRTEDQIAKVCVCARTRFTRSNRTGAHG